MVSEQLVVTFVKFSTCNGLLGQSGIYVLATLVKEMVYL